MCGSWRCPWTALTRPSWQSSTSRCWVGACCGVARASVGVQVPGLLLIPQRVENYRPPEWPGASIVHLDLTAGEHLDEPVKRAVALGARPADPQPDARWKVLLDPAGHPFCITTLVPPLTFSRPERCKPEPRPGRESAGQCERDKPAASD